jgi:cytochrome c peroxidase
MQQLVFSAMALLVTVQVAAAQDLTTFHRQTLLKRFDSNQDQRLNDRERRALRRAFGGIDVPMLSSTLFSYMAVRLPSYLKEGQLDELDNTPADNPISDHGATLGRVLFYDRQLSRNNTVACGSCHLQRTGFADPRRVSEGFAGGQTTRNAMSLANLRYSNILGHRPGFFWDERAATLEAQVLMPIQDKLEMGMTLPGLEERLSAIPYYPPLFAAAFGSSQVTSDRVAKSVAQFMRSMVSMNSKFDRASATREDFSEQEKLGRSLFLNGADGIAEHGCAHCHVPPTFGMMKSLNNGLDMKYLDAGLGALDRPSNDPFTPSNDGKFKAPSIRNIELSAPYMHDGRFKTLEAVVEHYSSGVHPHLNLGLAFEQQQGDTPTVGFRFTDKQKSALVAFLKTLTDRQFVTDRRFSDPFVRLKKK